MNECRQNKNAYTLDEAVHGEQHGLAKFKGGVITFPADGNAGQMSSNEFVDKIKQCIETFDQRPGAYSVGNFFRGRYVGVNGEMYNEKSLSVEVNGLSGKSLVKLAEHIAKAFGQETLLVKDLNSGKILLVDTYCQGWLTFYESTRNRSLPVPLTEKNARMVIDRQSANGYIIVGACRGDGDFVSRTKSLLKDIQVAGFTYTPCYGGFIENKGSDNGDVVYEQGFIVYANKRDGSADFGLLAQLGLDMCGKYNQDSVLIKAPDTPPAYYNRNGEIEHQLNGDVSIYDVAQTYFTDLHSNAQNKIKGGSKPTGFSFVETYISPKPQCYSEGHVRYMKGEIFINR